MTTILADPRLDSTRRVHRADVVVIGGGPAGLAAALAAHQNGAKTLILERDHRLGGILRQCIHNGFGLHYFGEELTGPEYASRFVGELRKTDVAVMTDTFVLQARPDRTLVCVGAAEGLFEVSAGAIVFATGCRERTRGALLIPGSRPAGVLTAGCAQRLCNLEGYLPGKRIVVLGSGDIGLIMARRMAWEGAEVLMVCEIMPHSSGLNRNIVQCLEDQGIPLHLMTTVTRIHGRERLEGVTVARVDGERRPVAGSERYIACDTLLLSVGLIPENELAQEADIPLDRITGGAVVDHRRMTRLAGYFACGNALHVHDLVDNVSTESAIAGAAAARFALLGERPTAAAATSAGPGIAQVVPQFVGGEEPITLYYRVTRAFRPARVTVTCGDRILAARKKAVMTPGEMEQIEIDPRGAAGIVEVAVADAPAKGELL